MPEAEISRSAETCAYWRQAYSSTLSSRGFWGAKAT
jgi:hypothetical protein